MPKVHKPNHPFKIIISYVDSPMYSLASFLHNFIIKGISKAQSYISNSFELVEKLSNFRRVDNDYCFLLDTSLFANISNHSLANEGTQFD